MEEYNRRVADENDAITDAEQKKYNKAARDINDYWDFAYGRTEKQNTESPTPAPSATTQATAAKQSSDNAKEALRNVVNQLKASGKTDEELQKMIERVAPDYGLNSAFLINEWFGGGEVD